MPTPGALTCVHFQYGITNDKGFTAEAIFNEVNNTFKEGLIIATRNVTIVTLNTTYPKANSSRFLRSKRRSQSWRSFFTTDSEQRITPKIEPEKFESPSTDIIGLVTLYHSAKPNVVTLSKESLKYSEQGTNSRRKTAYLPSEGRSPKQTAFGDQSKRELVFYSDEFPVQISSIVNNPFCPPLAQTKCAIVSSTVCVLLEAGDNATQVRQNLLNGIGNSIQDGSFAAAIPPANQL